MTFHQQDREKKERFFPFLGADTELRNITRKGAYWWLSLLMTQPGSILRDLTHVRAGAHAERLYLYPGDVTENFLIKITDDSKLWSISKKVGTEVKIALTEQKKWLIKRVGFNRNKCNIFKKPPI